MTTDRSARRRRAPGRRAALLGAGAALALLLVVLLSASVGTVELSPVDAFRLIAGHIVPGMPWMSDGSYTPLQDTAVWEFRLPRTLLAIVAGAGLALAGTLMQALVHNPLAEPYLLGVSSGAGVGAVAVIALGGAATALSVSGAAFVGALVATALVYLFARHRGQIAPQRLILAGVALGSLFSAITSYLTLTTSAQDVFSVMFFLLGSLSAATYAQLLLPTVILVGVALLAATQLKALNALLVGDAQAASLGVNVPLVRTGLLLAAALLTAAIVSVTGGIGFVGLVIPHVVRIIVGTDHRRLVPLGMLIGALFLALADLAARVVAQPAEVPIGIVTAVVGAPFFLWLLHRDGRQKEALSR